MNILGKLSDYQTERDLNRVAKYHTICSFFISDDMPEINPKTSDSLLCQKNMLTLFFLRNHFGFKLVGISLVAHVSWPIWKSKQWQKRRQKVWNNSFYSTYYEFMNCDHQSKFQNIPWNFIFTNSTKILHQKGVLCTFLSINV